MVRVLTVIAEMGSGGAEAVVQDLALRLRASGDEVLVASAGGWRADELAAADVPVALVPLRDPGARALLLSARRLRGPLTSWRPDVVHAHNVRATAAVHAARLGRRRPPVVTTVHGLADDAYRPAVRVLERCSDAVVAVSDDVRDRLVAAGLSPERVVVVENAVPAPVRLAGPGTVRGELGIGADRALVLCAARLARPKRVDLLVDAWERVPRAHLLVAGDGPERPELARRVADSPAAGRISLLGDRDDVGRLLGEADLLVLPSDREGLPMAVLEAMAAGVPVLASEVGGLRGLRDLDPGSIALVEPGDAAALAAGVRDLLGDPARRARVAAGGLALVERRFSSARMVEGYRTVFQQVAATRKGVTEVRS